MRRRLTYVALSYSVFLRARVDELERLQVRKASALEETMGN